MGWNNSPISWHELERTLSGAGKPAALQRFRGPVSSPRDFGPDPEPRTDPAPIPYAELHAHSHYSFLDGASSPEDLVAEAVRLGLTGIAITDHDGFQGAPRFAEAASEHPALHTVYGAELSLGLDAPQLGNADPAGTHLLLLAHGVKGYHRLASAITEGQLSGGEKGRPRYDLEELGAASGESWVALTGCRKGSVRVALHRASNRSDGERAALQELDRLTSLFGHDRVYVELTDHGHPGDDVRNEQLTGLAATAGLPTIATNAVHAATRHDTQLAEAMAAIRSRRSLDELDPYLPASGSAHLRSGQAMLRRFAATPDAVTRTAQLASELAFPLRAASPKLPKLEVPPGHTQISWLRELAHKGAAERYPRLTSEVTERLEKELTLIESKDFAGYFLVVRDIVRFARERGILCQGRGSAANSAICYVLGITAVDSVYYRLPFERFLSSMRDEEPDIDVDFQSDRREEVIQYVYRRYGRRNAAQVANVISYRPKSAVRDAAKALGYDADAQHSLSKGIDRWSTLPNDSEHQLPPNVRALADRLLKAPRHLGIHSGGMVLTEQPVGEVCPVEHARMPGRTVLQWDKDDCASMGLVKFDLLGLGMLSALQLTLELAAEAAGEQWTLETIPKDEAGVYDMLCRGDALGVFQLESRAQLNTLPRLKPRCFYDLVVEIALIRPGPLQGGAIHPYLRRRDGIDDIVFPHPSLEPVLARTLGVPLFQEQLMQMAMTVGGCNAEEADQLRRAMGSKRGVERIERLREKLLNGMRSNGIDADTAAGLYAQIESFADFGFAESHSISFALLVYASAWCKLHYPAAFLIGLLRSQPMGFYAPRTLVEDARRHGVKVLPADVQHPVVQASLEALQAATPTNREHTKTGRAGCLDPEQPPVGEFDASLPDTSSSHRRDSTFSVRLGLAEIRGIGKRAATRIMKARRDRPFESLADLARRADLDRAEIEALATAGACAGLDVTRREALWNAAPAADNRERFLPGVAVHVQPPLLPVLSAAEQTALDLWSTGIVQGSHPLELLRAELDLRGVTRSDALRRAHPGALVHVAGIVTHRQRPRTAGGITFLTLEDESGTTNVVVWARTWEHFRLIARTAPALIITGKLERSADGLVNVIAGSFEPLTAPETVRSRDFR